MLSEPHPVIKSMVPSPDEKKGSLLSVDLDKALDRYVKERALVVERLKELSKEDWQQTAEITCSNTNLPAIKQKSSSTIQPNQ
jgi:hypothetical protein